MVLLCKHSGEGGGFELIVNRPLVTTGRVVVNVGRFAGDESNETISTDRELQVWVGGPVEPQQSWMLVAGDPTADGTPAMRITDGLYLSTSPDLLKRMLEPEPPPNARLVMGYSGWGPGQLEE